MQCWGGDLLNILFNIYYFYSELGCHVEMSGEKVKTKSPSGDMRIKGTKQSCGGGGGALTDCDHSSQHCLTFGFQSSVPPLPGSTTEVGCADLAPGATGAWLGSHINTRCPADKLSV